MKHFYNLRYGNESPYQDLDLYLPSDQNGPYPVLFFIHGGGWQIGDKRDDQFKNWIHFVDDGYALASINYRMSPNGYHPDEITDAKQALKFLRNIKDDYNLDMDRVAAVGTSAGGHSALMMATSVNNPKFSPKKDDVDIKCCVTWYAPTDFFEGKELADKSKMGRIRYGIAINCLEHYYGKPFDSLSDLDLVEASPVTYIDENLPPVLLQHGNRDIVVPYVQAHTFKEAAEKRGVGDRVTVEIFNKAGHVDKAFETEENKKRVKKFIDSYIKKSS